MLRHRLIIAAVLIAVFVAGAAMAQDWPQWRGPNRDGQVTGFTAPEAWPTALTQGWRVALGNGDATPALVGDKLYVFTRVGEEEITTCLNVADGTQVWQNKVTAAPATGPGARHPGPRASVSVAEGSSMIRSLQFMLTARQISTICFFATVSDSTGASTSISTPRF